MRIERTFWEKATAVHVFCKADTLTAGRLARRWYDLIRLDDTGYAATATPIATSPAKSRRTKPPSLRRRASPTPPRSPETRGIRPYQTPSSFAWRLRGT
jgi:hypothetical protein